MSVLTVIVDIDGTLTIDRFGGTSPEQFNPTIYDPTARSPFDWHRVGEDVPRLPIIELVQSLFIAGHYIILVTGRSRICLTETARWLSQHEVPYYALYMRTEEECRDRIPDTVVKRRLHDHVIIPFHGKPDLIIDDRQAVVDMWRELGYTCIQVAPGKF